MRKTSCIFLPAVAGKKSAKLAGMSNSKALPHGHDLDPAKQKNKWGLTPKQENFCHAYLVDFNVAKAERMTGISPGSGAKIMAKSVVRKRIAQIRLETGKAFDVTRERLMQELMRIVYADPTEVFEEGDYEIKAPSEWSDDLKSSISEIEMDSLIGGVKKIKRYDKTKAIELLSRMLGFNAPDVTVNKNLNVSSEVLDKADAVRIAKQLDDLL